MNFLTSRLEELTTCSICREQYTEPKILSCYHTFCTKCLQGVFDQSTCDSAPCPICRRSFVPPERRARNLPSCPFMQDVLEMLNGEKLFKGDKEKCAVCEETDSEATTVCIDCNTFMCERCTNVHRKFKTDSHDVLKLDEMKDTSVMAVLIAKKSSRLCVRHPLKPMEFLCLSCNVLVCNVCNDIEHGSHFTQSINQCKADTKNMISTASLQFKPEVENIEGTINSLRQLIAVVQSDKNAAETEIQTLADQFVGFIREKEKSLLCEVKSRAITHNKTLKDSLENAEMQLSMRHSLLQYMTALTTFGNDEQLAQERQTLQQRSDQLHQQELISLPDRRNFKTCFKSSEEVQRILNSDTIGHIVGHLESGIEVLDQTTVSDHFSTSGQMESLPPGLGTFNNTQPSVVFDTASEENSGYLSPCSTNEIENTTPKETQPTFDEFEQTDPKQVVTSGTATPKPVTDANETNVKEIRTDDTLHRNNLAENGIKQCVKNIYEEVDVNDEITEDSQAVGIQRPSPRCGTSRETLYFKTQVKISGMDITDRDEIIVVSNSSKKCLVFKSNGSLVNDFNEHLISPWDAAASKCHSGEGEIIFLTDTGRKTGDGSVKEYSIQGRFIKVIATKLKKPYGITVSRTGDIYVCDAGERCVVMINTAKKKIKKIKENTDGLFYFTCPWYVSVNPNREIVISDFEDGYLKVYDSKKKQTSLHRPRYRSTGSEVTEFRPAMSCTDSLGNLYVVDQATNFIHVVTADHKSMKIFIPSELGITKPITLALDSSQRLWIGSRRGDVARIPYDIIGNK